MNRIKILAQYYVDLMVKLGIVRFSILLATVLVALALVVQIGVTLFLQGSVHGIDVVRSVFFGLLITPWAVYFLSVVVEQQEESRQRLANVVSKLEEMRERDLQLNAQLQEKIQQLSLENEERCKAEHARQIAMEDLENEVYEREQAQIQLAQQGALLRSFLDASPDLVYYRNEQGQFSGCNRAMELLAGKVEKQLIGLTPWDVYSKDVANKVVETDADVFQHNMPLTYEQWLDYPDGRKACFELRKVPFYDRQGVRRGLMGFGRDITERKRYQEAQEKASRDKTTFISTVSHELRTPLNGIVGLSRILLDTELTTEQHKYLKTIHLSAITLGHIFNDIIDMDKLDRRRLEVFKKPTDFIGLISDLENLSGLLAEQKGLKFHLVRHEPLPDWIEADGTRLRQILWNLIGNAMKFTQEGGVTLTLSAERQHDSILLRFSVQDTGVGIPAAEIDKIFAMYYQVKGQDGRLNPTGTGIGLAVSRRLAQMMGGDIHVTSELNSGSCFTLEISCKELQTPATETQNTPAPISPLHILLVEDIELNVVVARSVLEKLGHSLDVAMTGEQALQLYQPDKYNLVLLDIQLPDMTGFDIACHLRERYSALPPLVALTANVLKDKSEYLARGMDDALSKPLSVKALQAMLTRQLPVAKVSNELTTTANNPIEQEPVDQERHLNTEMLGQYLELVGPALMLNNVDLFEKMLPEYLAILDSNMTARDQDGIVSEAHKIKGAAGSIGLKYIQQLAQQAQSPDLPAWWDNVDDWVDEIHRGWRTDVALLRQWINTHATHS
ncbi:MAG: aerobic respiration two-component sensor histidine kinase ArcB [Plesiomonas sp.]|uniref:aerobic respiration two-component sensor histidine kinase ArcB n=1 Tax=Plesiomonas sp. TaxID=2486279 RepID=UPI003EE5B660